MPDLQDDLPTHHSPAGRTHAALRNLLARTFGAVADVMMPPACVACHAPMESRDALCATCWGDIRFIRHPLCDRLGIPLPFDPGGRSISAAAAARPPAYDRARAVAHYDGIVRQLVIALKYGDRHETRRLLGRWMAGAGQELLADADVILPVPLARRRLATRRFNQSAILAHEVGRHAGRPVDPFLLRRTKNTRPQVGLTEDARRRNVAGAFVVPEAKRPAVAGRRIVLVDDVVTTGATVEACAAVLRRAGAARIDVLAAAMTLDGDDALP